jgi:hypothetical protein
MRFIQRTIVTFFMLLLPTDTFAGAIDSDATQKEQNNPTHDSFTEEVRKILSAIENASPSIEKHNDISSQDGKNDLDAIDEVLKKYKISTDWIRKGTIGANVGFKDVGFGIDSNDIDGRLKIQKGYEELIDELSSMFFIETKYFKEMKDKNLSRKFMKFYPLNRLNRDEFIKGKIQSAMFSYGVSYLGYRNKEYPAFGRSDFPYDREMARSLLTPVAESAGGNSFSAHTPIYRRQVAKNILLALDEDERNGVPAFLSNEDGPSVMDAVDIIMGNNGKVMNVNAGKDILRHNIEKGDVDAMLYLSVLTNGPESHYLIILAGEKGHSDAILSLIRNYAFGINGFEKNLSEAKLWLNKAVTHKGSDIYKQTAKEIIEYAERQSASGRSNFEEAKIHWPYPLCERIWNSNNEIKSMNHCRIITGLTPRNFIYELQHQTENVIERKTILFKESKEGNVMAVNVLAQNYAKGKKGFNQNVDIARHLFRAIATLAAKDNFYGVNGMVDLLPDYPSKYAFLVEMANVYNSPYAHGRLVQNHMRGGGVWPVNHAEAQYWSDKMNSEFPEIFNSDWVAGIKSEQADTRAALEKSRAKEAAYSRQVKEKEADRQAKIDFAKEQKSLSRAREREERSRQANAEEEQKNQGLRDLITGIQNTGQEIRQDLRQNQRDTVRAFEHDQRVQKENEASAKAEYERKQQAKQVESQRQREYLNDGKSNSANTIASSTTAWDCDRQWRADKCGDRHTVHNINTLPRAYTGDGENNTQTARDGSSSAAAAIESRNDNQANGAANSNTVYSQNDDNNEAIITPEKKREKINSGQVVGTSGRSNYSEKSALKEAQANLEGKASSFCNTKIYSVEISWLDHATKCDAKNGKFKCEVHANAICYNKSCNKLYCGTARSY